MRCGSGTSKALRLARQQAFDYAFGGRVGMQDGGDALAPEEATAIAPSGPDSVGDWWRSQPSWLEQAAEISKNQDLKTLRPSQAAIDFASGMVGPGSLEQAPAKLAAPFYSAVEKAVQGAKTNAAPAAQWAGMLRNAPGVKPEELQWLGRLWPVLQSAPPPRLRPLRRHRRTIIHRRPIISPTLGRGLGVNSRAPDRPD